ncbi:MAG: hypothetical protein KDA42_07555 [Planctomycetales bacterium]|nr:hypothetical protein [Planctomycetales bacterium]
MARIASATQDRRRRVLSEQMKGADTGTVSTAKPAGAQANPAYAEDALADQPRVSDFLPRRLSTLVLVISGVLLAELAVLALHLYSSSLSPWIAPERLAAIATAGPGSFANWFVISSYSVAGLLCFATYLVRRHRKDDYHGRYRIWRTASLAWLIAGLSASTGLHRILGDVLARLLPFGASGTLSSVAWLGPTAILLGPVVLRLALELRENRTALVLFTSAQLAWIFGIAVGESWITLARPADTILMACTLTGNGLLVFSLLINARRVMLQAAGEVPAPRRSRDRAAASKKAARNKREVESRTQSDPDSDTSVHTQPTDAEPTTPSKEPRARASTIEKAHEEPRTPTISRASNATESRNATDARWVGDDGHDDEYDESGRKLSKAERKRLRKQRARQQRGERR